VTGGRRRALMLLAAAPLCAPAILLAQTKPRVARVGYLHFHTITEKPTPERAAFLAGLRQLGYEVGRNMVIEYRGAGGDTARLPELAAELVKLQVDVMVVGSVEAAAAAKAATSTIPLVVTTAGDPVYSGLVKSYARPGGNLTGLSFISPELGAKRLELVKEILPKTRRIAVIWNARDSISEREWDQAREAARVLGLQIDPEPVRETADLARTLDALPRERPEAVLVIVDARMIGFRKIIADAAIKARIPCVAGWRGYVESGALASYAPDFLALFHRAAYYVDRILKGTKPQDLPVEQPSKFELVVNLSTAAAIGIDIPKAVLLRADEVIR
jgi:putative tryptophan/tyrosine transport system substrate-binding protein